MHPSAKGKMLGPVVPNCLGELEISLPMLERILAFDPLMRNSLEGLKRLLRNLRRVPIADSVILRLKSGRNGTVAA